MKTDDNPIKKDPQCECERCNWIGDSTELIDAEDDDEIPCCPACGSEIIYWNY